MVMATPLVGLIDPADVMWISPAAAVLSGVVVAVLTTVSAFAADPMIAAIAPRPVEARRKRIKIQTPFGRRLSPVSACADACRGHGPGGAKATMVRNEIRRAPQLIRPPE